jgi:hypothetical protein
MIKYYKSTSCLKQNITPIYAEIMKKTKHDNTLSEKDRKYMYKTISKTIIL